MNKKNLVILLTVFLVAIFLSACGNSSDQKDNADNKEKVADEESKSYNESNKNSDDNYVGSEESDKNDFANKENEDSEENSNQPENASEDSNDNEGSGALVRYSSEEIEYARIWSQLGDTQDIDELNVHHISSGEPLNPDDETSIDYPENVVQLTGSRLVDGSITYSSNGDGSIKLYNKVPQRWGGENPAGENVYKQIIENTKQVSIDTGDDKKVEELIKKLKIHS